MLHTPSDSYSSVVVNTTRGRRRVWRHRGAAALNTQRMLADVVTRDQLVFWAWMAPLEASHLCSKWSESAGKHVECSQCSAQAHLFLEPAPRNLARKACADKHSTCPHWPPCVDGPTTRRPGVLSAPPLC